MIEVYVSPTVIDGREKITLEYERPEYGEVYDIEKATNYNYLMQSITSNLFHSSSSTLSKYQALYLNNNLTVIKFVIN